MDSDLYGLKVSAAWRQFRSESFAFWMICAYLFFEYVRPQSIYPVIDFLPWAQLLVVAALIGCFFDKTVTWVSSSINFLLVIFFTLILLSSYLAYFPEISFNNLDLYYLWVIIYFLIINIVNTRRRFFIFICIFLVASFKISLSLSLTWARRGFSFSDWGLMGPPGFFQNSGELAIQMLVFWPIAWAFAHTLKPHISRKWYFALMVMPITAIMVILGASSRGGQLALVCQLLVMNYRYVFNPKILIVIGVATTLIWTFLPDEQKQRFETMGEDRTSKQRLLYWENGAEMIQNNPVLGVGYFNFAPYFERYYPDDVLLGKAELPHNIFIQIGTDTGTLGLAVFSGFLLVAFKLGHWFKAEGCEDRQALIGRSANLSLLGFVVAGQFVTVAYYPYLWIHLALIVALTNSFKVSDKRRKGRL
ncbi:O-antigen ligase family protein [Marinobacter sp.]|uniref:O-antigen ligase family protein n=1 Tax=Marinobacter sp. TaxID=50741 RepID=UPI0034A44169